MAPASENQNKSKPKKIFKFTKNFQKDKAYGFVDKYVFVKSTHTYQPDGRVGKLWTTLRSELSTALPTLSGFLPTTPQAQ